MFKIINSILDSITSLMPSEEENIRDAMNRTWARLDSRHVPEGMSIPKKIDAFSRDQQRIYFDWVNIGIDMNRAIEHEKQNAK